jgi:TolB-like protein
MKTTKAVALLTTLMLVGGCASGKGYVKTGFDFSALAKIAVIDVQGDIKTDAAKNQVADLFEAELIKKGYTLMERTRAQTLLKEQQSQTLDLAGPRDAARAGLILDVPAVLVIDIPELGGQMTITAKMIDTETGGILWMADDSGGIGAKLAAIVRLGPAMADQTSQGLSPQKASQAKIIIKKMCKTLPAAAPTGHRARRK